MATRKRGEDVPKFKRQKYRAINEARKKELKSQLVFFVASLPGEESIQQLDELS